MSSTSSTARGSKWARSLSREGLYCWHENRCFPIISSENNENTNFINCYLIRICVGLDWSKDGDTLAAIQDTTAHVTMWDSHTLKANQIDSGLKFASGLDVHIVPPLINLITLFHSHFFAHWIFKVQLVVSRVVQDQPVARRRSALCIIGFDSECHAYFFLGSVKGNLLIFNNLSQRFVYELVVEL